MTPPSSGTRCTAHAARTAAVASYARARATLVALALLAVVGFRTGAPFPQRYLRARPRSLRQLTPSDTRSTAVLYVPGNASAPVDVTLSKNACW